MICSVKQWQTNPSIENWWKMSSYFHYICPFTSPVQIDKSDDSANCQYQAFLLLVYQYQFFSEYQYQFVQLIKPSNSVCTCSLKDNIMQSSKLWLQQLILLSILLFPSFPILFLECLHSKGSFTWLWSLSSVQPSQEDTVKFELQYYGNAKRIGDILSDWVLK